MLFISILRTKKDCMAELWSDYTDGVIKNIDKQIGTSSKYKFTLRSLLTDPSKYAAQPNVQMAIGNLKEEVGKYIEGKSKAMEEERKVFEDAMASSDAVTSQLDQLITMHARQGNVPVIRPVTVDRDTTRDETIYISSMDGSVEALLERLVAGSMLIADSTTAYGNYRVGEWLFSGSKNYVLSVFLPTNSYFLLQSSRDELVGLLDAASDFIKGL